ncbi:VOC family protein [Parvularcula sp. IMCC14364]|uniref:VOC family protein n=1 Tax=Parvularcula sp. IMCC14364 TaxID=3067902 RepID=UPI0035567833
MTSRNDLGIDYIEFPATDMAATKAFYAAAFGWQFTDYGPDYASFDKASAGMDGGFTTETEVRPTGTLAVLYAADLEAALEKVKAAGGEIVQDIFSFPGGRRFHFRDPSGNELAVWTMAAETMTNEAMATEGE